MDKEFETNINDLKVLKTKQRIRKILRAFLIVLNSSLVCYLLISLTTSTIKYIKRFNEVTPQSFIKIDDMSKRESLRLYRKNISVTPTGEFIVNEAMNYSYYGGYLHFKNNNDIVDSSGSLYYSSYSQYVLKDLTKDVVYSNELDFIDTNTSFNKGIDLFNLKQGSYIVYPYDYKIDTKKMNPIKINSESGIYETIYSPLNNGLRKKIELRSNSVSPCFVINVKDILYVPNDHYDISLLASEEDMASIQNVLKNEQNKIKYINKNKSIKENIFNLYNSKAPISIVIEEGNEIYTSNYLTLESTNTPSIISEGNLKGLDDDVYIRELAGDVFGAGKGLSSENDENSYLTQYISNRNNGSYVIKVGKDKIDQIPALLEKIR